MICALAPPPAEIDVTLNAKSIAYALNTPPVGAPMLSTAGSSTVVRTC